MSDTPVSAKELYVVKKRTVKRYTFFLALAFPLFFFNFEFGFVDLLPDFIGMLFLFPLFSSLCDLSDKFEIAYRKIRFAALISVAKLVSIFVVFGFVATKEGGYSSSLLAFGFVFAVLDIVFVADAFRTFFDGMDDLAQKYGCSSLTKPRGVSGKNRTERMKTTTVIFIIARSACAVLPELSTTSMHTVDDAAFPWANFTGLFRVCGAAVCLVFGMVWMVRMLVWLISLIRDKDFTVAVSDEYVNRLPNLKTRFILRDSAAFYGILTVGAFFCIDIFFEQNTLNLLSDAFCAILTAVAVVKGKRLLIHRKKQTAALLASCFVWGAIAAAKDVMHYLFYKNFSLFAIYRNEEAYTRYGIYSVLCVLSSVAFLVTVLLLCSLMKYLNSEYAVSKFNREDERGESILKKEHEEVEQSALRPLKAFAVVSAVVSALAPFVAKLSLAQTTAGTESWSYRLTGFLVSFGSAYGFIDGLVSLVFACLVLRGTLMFRQRVESKLMLE